LGALGGIVGIVWGLLGSLSQGVYWVRIWAVLVRMYRQWGALDTTNNRFQKLCSQIHAKGGVNIETLARTGLTRRASRLVDCLQSRSRSHDNNGSGL
jgi:hypothetical protein